MRQRLGRWGLFILAVLIAAALWLSLRGLPDGKLHVWFLDVGQGDAILIRTPQGSQILVDGGPSPTALLNEVGDILPFWDRYVDLVILSHADADHLNGLVPFLERYRVGLVLEGGCGTQASSGMPAQKTPAWDDAVRASHAGSAVAERGTRFSVGGTELTVLHPPRGCSGEAGANSNSIVLRLDYGTVGALLTGDAEADTERDLLASGVNLRADVLKVGHHGSAGATTAEFITTVAPSLAIIPVGSDNDFGHPRAEVLARLGNIPVLRTDLDGRVEVISDGARLWSRTER